MRKVLRGVAFSLLFLVVGLGSGIVLRLVIDRGDRLVVQPEPQVTEKGTEKNNPWLCLIEGPLKKYDKTPAGFSQDWYFNDQESDLSLDELVSESISTSYTNLDSGAQTEINIEEFRSEASVDRVIRLSTGHRIRNFSGSLETAAPGYQVLSYTSQLSGKPGQVHIVFEGTRLGFFEFLSLDDNVHTDSQSRLNFLKQNFCF